MCDNEESDSNDVEESDIYDTVESYMFRNLLLLPEKRCFKSLKINAQH